MDRREFVVGTGSVALAAAVLVPEPTVTIWKGQSVGATLYVCATAVEAARLFGAGSNVHMAVRNHARASL